MCLWRPSSVCAVLTAESCRSEICSTSVFLYLPFFLVIFQYQIRMVVCHVPLILWSSLPRLRLMMLSVTCSVMQFTPKAQKGKPVLNFWLKKLQQTGSSLAFVCCFFSCSENVKSAGFPSALEESTHPLCFGHLDFCAAFRWMRLEVKKMLLSCWVLQF